MLVHLLFETYSIVLSFQMEEAKISVSSEYDTAQIKSRGEDNRPLIAASPPPTSGAARPSPLGSTPPARSPQSFCHVTLLLPVMQLEA